VKKDKRICQIFFENIHSKSGKPRIMLVQTKK